MTNESQEKPRFLKTLALAGAVAATLFAAAPIAVSSSANAAVYKGFLYSGGSFTTIEVPGAYLTYANGINDVGQIVGGFADSTGFHGFLDSGGSFTTIDLPGADF